MNKVIEYIESQRDNHIDQLIQFLKIPSVSSEINHKSDMITCANWLIDNLKNAGMDKVELIPTKGHSIVYSESIIDIKLPTVLIYGHYDVQPIDPIELWDSPPFEPTIRDGKIYGRGTSDDKGQVFTHIKAVEAYNKTSSKLPVNIKFLIEGEEECGSHLDEFIINNPEKLKCDVVLISDTEWFAKGTPSICYGLRGITFIEISLTGPNRDLHSGTHGGAVDNPINALCWMLTQLKDIYGRITIPGFYDEVLKLTNEERNEFKRLPFDEIEYKSDLDIFEVFGEIGFSTFERTWARPSLDINGIWGGYIGDGAKTVLPSKASAKISMRLVPNQNAEITTNKVVEFLRKLTPPTMRLDIKPLHWGNPVLSPISGPGVQAAKSALRSAFGIEPVFMREGGSIPIVEVFQNVLGSPAVLIGYGLPDDNIHSPNESFSLENFYGGIKANAYFLEDFSKLSK